MKLSVVIPHMIGVENADFMLKKCINSLVGHDEIIVVANEGMGYGAAVNEGLRLATGEFLVVANNDTWLDEGTLQHLIFDNTSVIVPKIIPEPKDRLPRAFYCVPRYVYGVMLDNYGYYYDERFEMGYWEDDDLIKRLDETGVSIGYAEAVVVHHLSGGGMTMKQIGEQKYWEENKQRYDEKWS